MLIAAPRTPDSTDKDYSGNVSVPTLRLVESQPLHGWNTPDLLPSSGAALINQGPPSGQRQQSTGS